MNSLAFIALIIAIFIIVIFFARSSGKEAAKSELKSEVLDDVKKVKAISESIDRLSPSDKRERLRKFTK